MSKIWPQSTIRELLAQAASLGESKAMLATREAAEKFRYSIYAFRKAHNIGYDVSITIEDTTVVATRKELPMVTLLSETANV